MQCERARELLSEARYAQDGDAPELRAHVAECAACRAFRDSQAALDRVLALDQPAVPRPGFDTRFFAQLEQEKARVQRGRARRRFVWTLVPLCAGAAAVLLFTPRPASLPAGVPVPVVPAQPQVAEPAGTQPEAVPGPANIEPGDLALAMDLDLVEDIDVVQKLDELEDYEVLNAVGADELERLAREAK
jgi:hypothetical protein